MPTTSDKPILTSTAVKQIVEKIKNDDTLANISQPSADKVAKVVTKEVSAVIVNQTNQEPWWKSRVILGTVVTILIQIANRAGIATDTVDPEGLTTLVMDLVSVVAAGYALYGRTVAKKPIGE